MSNETTLDDVLALVANATPGPFDTGTKAPIGLSTPWDMVATDDGEPVAYCNYGPKDAAAIAAAVNYLRAHGDELRAALEDSRRLDYIERTYSGMTNRERYLPVQMIWGKGCNGRTLREACDKYMKRDAATGPDPVTATAWPYGEVK